MFIFVGCAGGGTSSMFCQRLVKEINEYDENLRAVFDDVSHVFQKRLSYGSHYDLVFAYGAAGDIRPYNAFDFGQLFDAVLIAPQVSYLKAYVEEMLAKYPSMVMDLPGRLFGVMDTERAYVMLLDLLINLDMRRGYQSQLLSASKGTDKDMEIYVAGAGSQEIYWKNMFKYLEQENIRYCVTSYSLENLYDFKPKEDFDVRFIFGQISVLSENDFARVARRIDGFLVNASSIGALRSRREWLEAYDIPYIKFDDAHVKKDLKNGNFVQQEEKIWDFLEKVQMKTEYTHEKSVSRFEQKEMAKQKTALFGLISWEEN
ncbi:hypothetical protein ACFO26_09680 [Lactococcus nasutitermitis]|uniref:PTS EIIB type-3 domain-containing protein n=1 Tax=Lactococcus nasutitermitis TaxID=1652957 RepID=A0ABV9JFC6_9LACT|nr:hypothetical protein [Lactococcus nasutitermitis]